jgi:hypothetical protein
LITWLLLAVAVAVADFITQLIRLLRYTNLWVAVAVLAVFALEQD